MLNQVDLHEIFKNGNILYSNAQNFTDILLNKKPISAKEVHAEFKLKVISAIESCIRGCLGWMGLTNFLQAPSTAPFTKACMVDDSIPARR